MILTLASPWFALLIIPVLVAAIASLRPKTNATLRFSNMDDMPRESLTVYRYLFRLVELLKWSALILLVLALCRPLQGFPWKV